MSPITQIPFGLVVVKRDAKILHEAKHGLSVTVQTIQQGVGSEYM